MNDAIQQYTDDQAPRMRGLLLQLETQMLGLLRSSGSTGAALENPVAESVHDFKEIAGEEAQAVVDSAHAAHAMHELRALRAALRRLDVHGYGLCGQCGDAIDMRRLEALPATAMCAGCQTAVEHEQAVLVRQRGAAALNGIADAGGLGGVS